MNIHAINGYTQQNITKHCPSFKERDIVDDYIKTPYEQEMDWLDKETSNQIKLMEFFHKDNPVKMKKAINEILEMTTKKSNAIRAKYLKPKNFFQKLFKL